MSTRLRCVRARARAQSHPHPVGAQVILASADSSLKAGMLRTLKARIDRIVHYSSVCDAAMRRHRREVLSRRKSTCAKIMAAVTLRATGGTIRGLAAFCRLERKSSGNVSAVANVGEAGEGSEIVWGHVKGDLDIYITQDGHCVSLRKVLEVEILNYEQGEPTKKAHVTPAGRKVAPKVAITETKHTASVLAAMGGTAETAPVCAAPEAEQVCRQGHLRRQPDLQDEGADRGHAAADPGRRGGPVLLPVCFAHSDRARLHGQGRQGAAAG
jgi:hypothetical protein